MKNKKLFFVLISMFVCLLFIAGVGSTGCLYKIGKNIGEYFKHEVAKNSNTVSDDDNLTGKTPETTVITDQTDIASNDHVITESDSISECVPATDMTSTTYEENNKQVNNSPKNEIQVSFDMDYMFSVTGEVSGIDFIIVIPKEYKDRQMIANTQYSTKPKKIFDDGSNTYAEFEIDNPASNFEINIMDEIVLTRYDLCTAMGSDNKNFDIENLDIYNNAERYIESDDEDIKKVSQTFQEKDKHLLIREIYNYVMDNMEWSGYVPEDVGAKAALIEKRGDCTSYSDLLIALLRSKGIPARIAEGYTIDATDDLSIGHNWVEVYFDDIGWVPLDPTYDDNNGSTSLFDNLNNIYVYLSLKRNDLILDGFHYFVYNWYGTGKVEVSKNISVN